MYEELIRPILFAISEDNHERAHRLTLSAMKVMQRVPFLLRLIERRCGNHNCQKPTFHSGIVFPNDIGLAAGFDKQGEVVRFIQALGFGFAEIGTVLPKPQPGNPEPRIFRLPEEQAIINRMGFNSRGAEGVGKNLKAAHPHLHIPIGISVSKNKTTPTTPEATAQDCIDALKPTLEFADYIALGLSSPNTPNLRDLQRATSARIIVRDVVSFVKQNSQVPPPVLVKLTCDLNDHDLYAVCEAALEEGARGFVASNTTLDRPFDDPKPKYADEQGGLSGSPLHMRAVEMVGKMRKVDDRMLLMGVGGVDSSESANRMRDAGANVVQMYTSLVYKGRRALIGARGF